MAQVIIRVFNAKRISKPGVADPDWFDLDVDQATSPLKLNISAVEIGELGDVFGIGSQQFTLPSTPTNNDFFNYAFNINSDEAGFTFQKTFTCQILVDGGAIASGKLYFDSTTTDNKGNHIYNCTFTDAVPTVADIYKDTLIGDLDWSEYDHNLTVNNITGSWDELLFNGDIIYPNVVYGYPENVSNWAWDASYFVPWNGTLYTDNSNIPLNAFKPSIRIKSVFDKIFNSINYEYESNFISNSTSSFGAGVTASFSDLYMLMTADANLGPVIDTPVADGEWYDALHTQTIVYAGGTATGIVTFQTIFGSTGEVFDPNNIANFGSSNNITFPYGGTYRIEPDFTFRTNTAGTYTVELENITTGDTYTLIQGPLAANTDYTHNQSIEFELTSNLIATIYAYRINVSISNIPGYNPGDPSVNVGIQLKENNLRIDNAAYDSGLVEMSPQFGDLKIVDFLKGLTEQFNLVWWADKENPRKIYVEPWNEYIKSGVELDWSDKVDYGVKWEISHPSADAEKVITFTNVEDEDTPNKNYLLASNLGKPFGSYTYQAQSDYSEGEKEIGSSFFAPTVVKPIPGTNAISAGSNMTIPHIYISGESPRPKLFKFKPRLLFKNGKKSYTFPYRVGGQTLTTYYQMTPSTDLYYDAAKFDLNFSSYNWFWGADNVVTYNHYTDNDSFNVFWANYINNIYRNPARKVTLNIKFEPVDLFSFRVNDLIFIDGQTYLINKINGFDLLKPTSTEVELIKVLYPSYNKPVFIVEGNDDIRVPGHGDPTDDIIGHEWTFEPDSGDPTKVVPTDIVNNDPINVDSIKKTLIRQQGFLPSGSVVWKDIKWDKQSVNTNIKNNLQYGVNTGGNQSANSINLGTKNEVNSQTNNTIIAGNTNIVGLTNTNLNIIGDNNNIGRENNNLVYIGDNSNSGVNFFRNSIVIDIVSGSNNLNSDNVEKTGIFALNNGVVLAGAHSGSFIVANVSSGSSVTTIGKNGYSVDNSFFIGNDDCDLNPTSSISNFFVANNSKLNIIGYQTSSTSALNPSITIFNNSDTVIKQRIAQSFIASNDRFQLIGGGEGSSFNASYQSAYFNNYFGTHTQGDIWTTSIGNNDFIISGTQQCFIAGNANSSIKYPLFCTIMGNIISLNATSPFNNRNNSVIGNSNIRTDKIDYSTLLGNSDTCISPCIPGAGTINYGSNYATGLYRTIAVTSSYATFIGNNQFRGNTVFRSLIAGNHSCSFVQVEFNNSAVINNENITGSVNTGAYIHNNTLLANNKDSIYRGAFDSFTSINDDNTSYNNSTLLPNINTIGLNNSDCTFNEYNIGSFIAGNIFTETSGGTGNLHFNNYYSNLVAGTYNTFLNNFELLTSGSNSNVVVANSNFLTLSGSITSGIFINDRGIRDLKGGEYNIFLNNTGSVTLNGKYNNYSNNSGNITLSGSNNAILNNTGLLSSGSTNNSSYINNNQFTVSGSVVKNTFINNSGSVGSVGTHNTLIGVRGTNHVIGTNKAIFGFTSGTFDYNGVALAEAAPAVIVGSFEPTLYVNQPNTANVEHGLFTGKQLHYGAQYHAYQFLVGSAGATVTVTVDANTYLLDWFSTAGTATVNLPIASDVDGMRLYFKANNTISSTKVMRLTTTGGETIDGAATLDINTAYEKVVLMAMDSNWWILDN